MRDVPGVGEFDSTLAFLREGYPFFSRRFAQCGSDMFRTRLMLTPVTCMRGALAARLFYAERSLTRRGAMPATAVTLLQDYESVQTLDGPAHRDRKAAFLGLRDPARVADARALFAEVWTRRLSGAAGREIALLDFSAAALTETALRWCGLDAGEDDVARRCEEMTAMIEGAGGVGLAQLRGQRLRARSERWARGLTERRFADPDGPLAAVLAHRGAGGARLPRAVAAVEALNVIRPIVAVSRFVAFAGHALATAPALRDELRAGTEGMRRSVAQEVRRFYPFFPAIGARTRERVTLMGVVFEPGDWLLLDIYGTNRHPKEWPDPDAFLPQRFLSRDWRESPLCAQGAGDVAEGHRCPGEDLTIALLTEAVGLLAEGPFEWTGRPPPVRLDRMPAAPEGGSPLRVGAAARAA